MKSHPSLTEDAFLKQNRRPGLSGCSVKRFLDTLTPENADAVRKALVNPKIQLSAIRRVLQPLGWTMSHYPFERHRNHGCVHCGVKALGARG